MDQYPHFLFVKVVPAASQDAEGNFSFGGESWVFHSFCREQTNGKGSAITGADGKAIVFSSVIHLPVMAGRIMEGTEVKVTEGVEETDFVRIKGQALKFDKGRLHNRVWV